VRIDTRMPSVVMAAFVLWIAALSLSAACSEGDKKMPPFGSKSSSSWNELSVPGVELLLETEQASPYRSWGAARIDGARADLRGKEAFDAARARAGNDPTALATLAMLFLDDGVAGKKPWTQPGGARSPEQQAIARPPALSGDTLVYWRAHAKLADLVRCRVSLSSGTVTCELGGDVLQAERVAKDPAGTARQDLASSDLQTRTRGIEALGRIGDDHARAQLIELALNAYEREERRVAVTVLAKVGGAGVVATVSRVLLFDRSEEVRQAAATTLGALHDPAARDALTKAASGDADARVQVLASDALKQLK
jgi:HEAT repeat protein